MAEPAPQLEPEWVAEAREHIDKCARELKTLRLRMEILEERAEEADAERVAWILELRKRGYSTMTSKDNAP